MKTLKHSRVDWREIRLRYKGIEGLAPRANGSLELNLGRGWRPLADAAPRQAIPGECFPGCSESPWIDGASRQAGQDTPDYGQSCQSCESCQIQIAAQAHLPRLTAKVQVSKACLRSGRSHQPRREVLITFDFRLCTKDGVQPTDLQDGAEKCVQSPPNSTARIRARQSGVALFPQENPNRLVPEGRLTIAHRFNGGTSGDPLSPQVPEGRLRPYPKTRFSRPSGIWKKGRVFPPLKRWAGEAVEDSVGCPS